MVRAIKNPKRKTVKELQTDILKHRSLRVSLEHFLKILNKKHQNMTRKQYLIRIHNYIKNFKTVAPNKVWDLNKVTYDYVRICRGCNNWNQRKNLIECAQCEDLYHMKCAKVSKGQRGQWMCDGCCEIAESLITRQQQLDRHYKKEAQNFTKKCNKCKGGIQDAISTCERCRFHYHDACFSTSQDEDRTICFHCEKNIEQLMRNRKSLHQRTLYDYYPEIFANYTPDNKLHDKSEADTQISELTINYIPVQHLKSPIKLTQKQIQEYKKQLLYAICYKNMQYSEELVFETKLPIDVCCQDPTLDYINQKDQKAYKDYKKQPFGPYRMILIQGMGFDVKADKIIPKGTIICQYIGEVITRRNALNYLQNDSLMDLSFGIDADSSFIIKPEKWTNMARFINGVNNNDPHREKKINVATLRVIICGRPTVLLYAKRRINKDESLIYDYNAGGLNKYQTSCFL